MSTHEPSARSAELIDKIVRHVIHGHASPLGSETMHAERDERHLRKQLSRLSEKDLEKVEEVYNQMEEFLGRKKGGKKNARKTLTFLGAHF